jgi:hypothetical protein
MIDEIKKPGVWCVDEQDRLGISAEDQVFTKAGTPEYNADGTRKTEPTFHVVDDNGNTTMVIYRSWAGLRRAPAAAIPAARVVGLSLQDLADMGYEAYGPDGKRIEPKPRRAELPTRIQVVSGFVGA